MGAAPIREGYQVVEPVLSFVLKKASSNPSEIVWQPREGSVTLRISPRNPMEIAGLPSSKTSVGAGFTLSKGFFPSCSQQSR
jgi:hypothetical protein